ncbi:MAG: glycosyltransferase [Candidatus Methanoperedens sp.]|nr:glycosyltransferase [Candidatus Methanoperedens sp.]
METKTFFMTSSYYPPYHIGGDATHVKYLSEELVKLGHEVHVMFSLDAYRYKKPGFKGSLKEVEDSNGVFLHPLQSYLGQAELYLTYLLGKSSYTNNTFQGLLNDIKPDIVHHHNIFFLGYDILKKQGNYTNLYTAHDYWLICQRFDLMKYGQTECMQKSCLSCTFTSKRLPQMWRKSTGFRGAIRDIDTIIAPSDFMKKRLSDWLPVKADIVHIPNFVPSPPGNIKDSGYPDYFLYVGVLERHKGICNLLKVFKEHDKEIDAKLIIVGEGSLKEKIVDYIARNKLQNKILVLGWLSHDNLWPLYKDALALIVPSICLENNPLVALEAISVGTPVVGTNAGGVGEIIGKIDKNLIFKDDESEVIGRVLNNKNIYSKEKIKQVYTRWYSLGGYLREYERAF